MRTRVAVLLLAVGLPAGLSAQGGSRAALLGGVEYYAVSFDSGLGTKSISEMVVPVGAVLPIGRRFAVDVGTHVVSARREDDAGNEVTISGMTDLLVRASLQVVPDVVALTMAVSLPTGQASLSGDQQLLAGAIATSLVPFPVTSFGSGLSATSGLAVALPVGSWALGAAGSFRYNGEYEPIDTSSTKLRPGGEYRVRVGLDRIVGQGRVSLGVTYSTFSRDEFGADQLSSGSRIITQGSWSLPLGNANLALYFWDLARSTDSASAATVSVPPQKENTAALGAALSLRTGRSTFRPSVEYRRSWQGQNSLPYYGSMVSLGARYVMAVGDRLTFVPAVRYDKGSVSDAGMNGLSAGLTLRASM